MQALLTGGRLVWLPGVGHMPNLERPEEFNDALVKFLNEIRSDSRQVARKAISVEAH